MTLSYRPGRRRRIQNGLQLFGQRSVDPAVVQAARLQESDDASQNCQIVPPIRTADFDYDRQRPEESARAYTVHVLQCAVQCYIVPLGFSFQRREPKLISVWGVAYGVADKVTRCVWHFLFPSGGM